MPSAALHKLASGLSSGGTSLGTNDNSSSIPSRGGGVIRGILNSLRAGRSTDSGSPRSSRTGLADGPPTPRGSHSQYTLAVNADGVRADGDESSAEELCKRALSSGPNGQVFAPSTREKSLSGESRHIALPLEVNLAASSSYSGRRSAHETPARSVSSARPSFESTRSETPVISDSSGIPAGSRGVASGPTTLQLSGTIELAREAKPPQASLSASAQPGLEASAELGRRAAEAPCGTDVDEMGLSLALAPAADTAVASGPDTLPSPQQNSGLRAFRSSFRRCLLEATDGDASAVPPSTTAPAAAAWMLPQHAASGLAAGVAGGGDDDRDGGGGCAATAAVVASSAIYMSAPQLAGRRPHQQPGQDQQQQQGQLGRPASGSALSAMAVSQAVHRLQLRQQQEKAAARFSRSSLHPAGPPPYLGNHHHNHHHNNHRDGGMTALTHRVPSAANAAAAPDNTAGNGSPVPGGEADAMSPFGEAAAAAAGATAVGTSPSTPLPPSHPNQQPVQQPQPHPHLSPARRLCLPGPSGGVAQVRSASTNFAFQHALYDSHRTALGGSCGSIDAAAGQGPATAAADRGDNGGRVGDALDEWLGDVPDVSRSRIAGQTPTSDWALRSSVSCTDDHVSAADRLQALLSSAASIGGDDAASYLQQLLVSDMPSTASVDLQYSANNARVPSVLALAYGSSSGPGAAGGTYGTAGSGGGGGLLGLPQNSSSSMGHSGYGEPFPPTSPASKTAAAAATAAAPSGASQARHLPAQGDSLYGDGGARPSPGGSSGTASRRNSTLLNSQASPRFVGGNYHRSHSSTALCSAAPGSSSSVLSALETAANGANAAAAKPHANKSAAQLVDELRELHAAAAAGGAAADAAAVAGSGRRGSTGAVVGAAFVAAADGGRGGGEHGQQHGHHYQQQRDELVAALWRLLRAKDSEAVSYLLAVDPSTKPNRQIAPVLKEMRSWVYLNMW